MCPVYKKIQKYSEVLDNLYFDWRRHFYHRNFLRQQIHTSIGHRCISFIRNVEKKISSTHGGIQFFIDYHKHSKDTVQIIKDGYGRTSNTLGSCEYHDGYMRIRAPEESKIADIGSARNHLRDGYPNIWKLKDEAESASRQKIEEIENLINEIKSRISSELERKVETTNTKLVLKPALFSSQREYPVSCYYDNTTQEIVNEIKMRLDGKIHENLVKHIE
jgi:hypothetical protein